MFTRSARYYDDIYGLKDYRVEAERLRELIGREHPTARTVLDVACGTGEHARHLPTVYRVDGVEIEPEFVGLAAAKFRRRASGPRT